MWNASEFFSSLPMPLYSSGRFSTLKNCFNSPSDFYVLDEKVKAGKRR